MKIIHERTDLLAIGLELALDQRIFGTRFVALRFGYHIIGIEWE